VVALRDEYTTATVAVPLDSLQANGSPQSGPSLRSKRQRFLRPRVGRDDHRAL